nr:hypothetical protein [Kozakia baliensis]
MGGKPEASELAVTRLERINPKAAFEPFERQLDLPAQSIGCDHLTDRDLTHGDRSEQKQEIR